MARNELAMNYHPAAGTVAAPRARRWVAAARKTGFFLALLAAYVGAQVCRMWVIRHAPPGEADWASLGSALLLSAALLGLYVGLARSLERRPARELAPARIQAVSGIILGLALFSGVFGLLEALGVARWQGVSARFDVIQVLSVSILAAVGEELAMRGGLFRLLEESFGTTMALVVSAIIFGLLHALNPGATALSTAAIALEAGVLLGAAYALTRNLWFPIGLHLGWNFTEGGVFGFSVSGGPAAKGIFAVSLSGRTLLTGGRFGPEASIIATLLCLAVAAVLLVLAVRGRRWQPMPRRAVALDGPKG